MRKSFALILLGAAALPSSVQAQDYWQLPSPPVTNYKMPEPKGGVASGSASPASDSKVVPVQAVQPAGDSSDDRPATLLAPVPPPVSQPSPTQPATGKEILPFPVQTVPASACQVDFEPHAKGCCFTVFGEYLYWTVHGADVPFAQAFDGIDPLLSVPRGPVGVASPQFNSGFRIGGGVSLEENQWLVVTGTYFRTNQTANISAGAGDVLHNFLTFPNTVNAAVDSLTSQASYGIQLYEGDLDYKCAIVHNDHLLLNWLAGIRYANLQQDLTNTFQVAGTTTVNSHIDFDGIGPRIGLEGEYHVKCGFYGYTHGVVDVLLGQFRGNYSENNVFTGLVGQTSINANRAVPILELEVGGGWQSASGRIRVSAGYYVGSWFNTMTTTSLSSGIGNVNFTTNGNNFRDNITFDGFVGRFEFRF